MNEKRIFRYVLADACGNIISQVDVIETSKEGTVRCLYFETDSASDGKAHTTADFYTAVISLEDIRKIREAMHTHQAVFSFQEVEFPTVIDGVINTFAFSPEKGPAHVIQAYNIWAIKEAADVAFMETPKAPYKGPITPSKGKEVLAVYDKISKILMENGVHEKYLMLG